jgi:SPP1 family predicted phage head-tail adaptor
MLWRDQIILLTVTDSTDENGFATKTITNCNTVYANRKSIRQSEFYMAQQLGIQLDLMFEIHTSDYQGEIYLEYDTNDETKYYKIVRTYDIDGEITQLFCSDLRTKGGILNG